MTNIPDEIIEKARHDRSLVHIGSLTRTKGHLTTADHNLEDQSFAAVIAAWAAERVAKWHEAQAAVIRERVPFFAGPTHENDLAAIVFHTESAVAIRRGDEPKEEVGT